jgi:hypothetical protein
VTLPPVPLENDLAAIVRGEPVGWTAMSASPASFVAACDRHGIASIVYERLHASDAAAGWPSEVVRHLAETARREAATELLRRREVTHVVEALAREGIQPILMKGTACAYTIYDTPSARQRSDTDLMIRRDWVDGVTRTLRPLGYEPTPLSSGELLFGQFELTRRDACGVKHAFDVHWKISTQTMFAEVVGYAELAAASVPVPSIGEHARAAGGVHALLLACLHPAMHHRNEERLLWLYDVHRLASNATAADLGDFVELAVERKVASVCAYGLRRAERRFGTELPHWLVRRLDDRLLTGEPSSAYLLPSRRWHDEALSNLRGLPSWSGRLRLLREILFPNRGYILSAYGVSGRAGSAMLLPALYAHRLVRGAGKILRRRK